MSHPLGWFHGPFSVAYFTGRATDPLVPAVWPCAINGHPYLLAEDQQSTAGDVLREESLPLLREQADSSDQPGESSISPLQFWRRGQEAWEAGAGQANLDRDRSDRTRFWASKGVDPWTPWRLTLLPSTASVKTFAGANPRLLSTGTAMYATDGTSALFRSTDGTTWSNVTGIPATPCVALATSGGTTWSAWGTSGIYSSTAGTATSYVTGTVDNIGYAKGRLLAAAGGALYNITASGALPAALWTHPDAAWAWTSFAEAGAFAYAAGYAGGSGAVYRTAVASDGSSLSVPIQAAALPTGEVPRSLRGYLGFLVIGTDEGVRFAVPDASGDLTVGALIPTPAPVECLDAADRFVWFGWSTYDATSTGLGRLDLSTLQPGLAPAYASDLMATGQAAVRGVAALGGKRYFAVSGDGIYAEQAAPVASGTLDAGLITYGLADAKIALYVDVRHGPLPAGASVAVNVVADDVGAGRTAVSSLAQSVSPPQRLSMRQLRGERFRVTLTLSSSAGQAPVLNRWTLLAQAAPSRRSEWVLPLQLYDEIVLPSGVRRHVDVASEAAFLRSLHKSGSVVSVQVGSAAFSAVIDSYRFLAPKRSRVGGGRQGVFIARVQEVFA